MTFNHLNVNTFNLTEHLKVLSNKGVSGECFKNDVVDKIA